MSKDIFLSVGGSANNKQEQFIQAVENRLRAEDLTPNTVGRNTFSVDTPLKTIEELMDRCVGTVVLALERSFFEDGIKKWAVRMSEGYLVSPCQLHGTTLKRRCLIPAECHFLSS